MILEMNLKGNGMKPLKMRVREDLATYAQIHVNYFTEKSANRHVSLIIRAVLREHVFLIGGLINPELNERIIDVTRK